MDKVDEFRLYDRILRFTKEQTTGVTTHTSFSVLKLQLDKEGTTITQFNDAINYLVSTEHLIEKYGQYKLGSNGREKLLNSFESEYLEKEFDKNLRRDNLIKTTALVEAQKEDIRKARARSWWAIGISVFAFSLSVIDTVYEHIQKDKNDGNNNKGVESVLHNPIHNSSKKPIVDSLK